MQTLLQRKTELENEINSLQPPLFYSQILKRDRLIKELREIKYKIFIGEKNEILQNYGLIIANGVGLFH